LCEFKLEKYTNNYFVLSLKLWSTNKSNIVLYDDITTDPLSYGLFTKE
jgi:hypothetical protein